VDNFSKWGSAPEQTPLTNEPSNLLNLLYSYVFKNPPNGSSFAARLNVSKKWTNMWTSVETP